MTARSTLAGLAVLTAGAALFGGATPAHADVTEVFPSASAVSICMLDGGVEKPAWDWTLDLGAASDTPVWFLVDIDNLAAQNIQLQPGEQSIQHHFVTDGAPHKIEIFAGLTEIFSDTATTTCAPPVDPPSATLTFSCEADGAYLDYGFASNEKGTVAFDVGLPDGTTEQWPFPGGTFHNFLKVDEDAPYDVSISLNGTVLASAQGVADCDPPVPPTTIPDVPDTVPTTEPTPPPTVLSSGESAETAEAPEAPAPEAAELPRTGTATGPMTAAGVSSLLVGSGFLALARRRRLQA